MLAGRGDERSGAGTNSARDRRDEVDRCRRLMFSGWVVAYRRSELGRTSIGLVGVSAESAESLRRTAIMKGAIMMVSLLAGVASVATLAAQSSPSLGSIAGHVFDSVTSAPVRKVTVRLMAGPDRVSLTATTDAEGKFEFTGLPSGMYVVSASHTGFLDFLSRRTTISLDPGGHIADATIRLPARSVIAGHVVDEDGDPLDRAQVVLLKEAFLHGRKLWVTRGNTTTNDLGEYRFSDLAPGHHILRAVDLRPPVDNRHGRVPAMYYVPEYYPSALSQQQAVPVDIAPGAEVRGIDIHLSKVARPPAFHVRGKVNGLPGQSRLVLSVDLRTLEKEVIARTESNPPDYEFDLTAPPGQYTIAAQDFSNDPRVYGTEPLTVTGDITDVMLAAAPTPEMTGRILLPESGDQVRMQNLRVQLLDTFMHAHEAQCDAAGRFVFSSPFMPGNYTINVLSMPDGFFVRDIRLGTQEISSDGFEVLASGQLEIVLSGAAGTISGSVEDADSEPFLYSTVTLIPLDGRSRPLRTDVDGDGHFRFTGLRPSAYKIFAWEAVDNDRWPDPEFLKKYEGRATDVTVGPRETRTARVRVICADEIK